MKPLAFAADAVELWSLNRPSDVRWMVLAEAPGRTQAVEAARDRQRRPRR
jgi:hypothetical protein